MWKDSIVSKPNLLDRVLVQTFSGQVFYAVYTTEDEFDVHRPDEETETRLGWYKYSSRTVLKWRYFSDDVVPKKYETVNVVPYQCCPKCNGSGKMVASGFTSSVHETCNVCHGAMIIPMHTSTSPNP